VGIRSAGGSKLALFGQARFEFLEAGPGGPGKPDAADTEKCRL
jgi:hypothetical protein